MNKATRISAYPLRTPIHKALGKGRTFSNPGLNAVFLCDNGKRAAFVACDGTKMAFVPTESGGAREDVAVLSPDTLKGAKGMRSDDPRIVIRGDHAETRDAKDREVKTPMLDPGGFPVPPVRDLLPPRSELTEENYHIVCFNAVSLQALAASLGATNVALMVRKGPTKKPCVVVALDSADGVYPPQDGRFGLFMGLDHDRHDILLDIARNGMNCADETFGD